MQAAFLYGRMDVRVEEAPAPQIEQPDDVLIQVAYTGICGSELHAIEGYTLVPHDDNERQARSPLGHEYSGVVAAVGPAVHTVAVGQRVTVAPRGPCHQCDLCRNGVSALCRKVTQRGGSWADWIVAPARLVHALPAAVPLSIGALTEPMSAALRIIDRANLLAGMNVCVIGAGPIGLFAADKHFHQDADEIFWFFKGTCRVTTPDGAAIVPAGEIVYTAPGEWHIIENAGDAPLRMFVTVTPNIIPSHTFFDADGAPHVRSWAPLRQPPR